MQMTEALIDESGGGAKLLGVQWKP